MNRKLRSAVLALCSLSVLYAQERSLSLVPDQSRASVFSVRVVNEAGKTVFRLEREQHRDAAPPAVHLFGNGSLLLLDGYAGAVEYYDGAGVLRSRHLIRGAVKPDHERVIVLSGTPSAAALCVSEPNEESVTLMLYDERGTRFFTKAIPGRDHASGVVLSGDGSLIATGSYRWEGTDLRHFTDILRSDGTALSTAQAGMTAGVFSPDRSLLLVRGSSSAAMLDVSSGTVVSSTTFGRGFVVHDVQWEGSAGIVAASPAPVFEEREWVYASLQLVSLTQDNPPSPPVTIQGPFRSVQLVREGDSIGIKMDGRSLKREDF